MAKLYARPEVADTASFMAVYNEFMGKRVKVDSPAIEQMRSELDLLKEKMEGEGQNTEKR